MGRHTAEPQSVRTPRLLEAPPRRAEHGSRVDRSRSDAAARFTKVERPRVVPAREAIRRPATMRMADVARTGAGRTAPATARTVEPTRAPRSITTSAALRRRATIPALSFFAVFGLGVGSLVNPLGGAAVANAAVIAPTLPSAPTQQYSPHGTYQTALDRDGYAITVPAPVVVVKPTTTTTTASTSSSTTTASGTTSAKSTAAAPAAGTPDPGSAKAIALDMVTARGWGSDQYNCLVSLWNRESGWNIYAYNRSGAYGIPQALPGSKMATAGADWQTNPATQITWGLNYITGSYGTPCGAWAHSQSYNWY